MHADFFPTLANEEMEAGINFHSEEVDLANFELAALPAWICAVIAHHEAQLGALQYIFCSDDYLHRLNVDYLDHDTLTDIITFPYAEPPHVSGDLYISTERVADNAAERNISFEQELQRVMIHGVLHLIGYGDKTEAEAQRMRELEEEALGML